MNFGDWVAWANNGSNPNPNVRILVGGEYAGAVVNIGVFVVILVLTCLLPHQVPAGSSAANPSNFVSASTLGSELSALQAQYPNRFGGVMVRSLYQFMTTRFYSTGVVNTISSYLQMWDASWAYDASPNYAGQAKQAMAGAAICNTPPPSSSTV